MDIYTKDKKEADLREDGFTIFTPPAYKQPPPVKPYLDI